jgi:hypothetical protein
VCVVPGYERQIICEPSFVALRRTAYHPLAEHGATRKTTGSRVLVTLYYEVAGSSNTPESFEDTEIFFYMVGELLFLDQDNKILWQKNQKTSIDRYTRYCADNGIPARDLTRWDA